MSLFPLYAAAAFFLHFLVLRGSTSMAHCPEPVTLIFLPFTLISYPTVFLAFLKQLQHHSVNISMGEAAVWRAG